MIKKSKIIYILFSILIMFLVLNDSFLYKDKVGKIISINTGENNKYKNGNYIEEYKTQIINIKLLNTKNKGKIITIKNNISSSSVMNEKYRINDILIIKNDNSISLKRDNLIVGSLLLIGFFILCYSYSLFKNTLLSFLFNLIIFIIMLNIGFKFNHIVLISIVSSILFLILSIILSYGYKDDALETIKTSIISFGVLFIITIILLNFFGFNNLNLVELEFATTNPEDIFLVELIIATLGIIMDISNTLVSAKKEIIHHNKDISDTQLKKSLKVIAEDILGTMINVLFFTFLASNLTKYILVKRNGITLWYFLNNFLNIDTCRFIISAIAVVITILVTIKIISHRKEQKC